MMARIVVAGVWLCPIRKRPGGRTLPDRDQHLRRKSLQREDVERMRKILVSIIIAAGLAGCAGTPPPQSSAQLTVIPDSPGIPAPNRSALAAYDRPPLHAQLEPITPDILQVPAPSREIQEAAK